MNFLASLSALTIGVAGLRWMWTMTTTIAMVVAVASTTLSADFTLKEHLGQQWTHECVTFPLTPAQVGKARAGEGLRGPGGSAVAYQLVLGRVGHDDAGPQICFQADVSPYGTAAFSFGGDSPIKKSDLVVEESAGLITLTNRTIGLRIRKSLKAGEGPIAGIRLGSGQWTGDSTVTGGVGIQTYTAEVVARGPVFADILCKAIFIDDGTWSLRFRVESGEPVVLIDETFDAPGGGAFCVVLGDKAFRPTHMLYRNADVTSAVVTSDPIAGYLLEPWLRWNNPRHGNWLALHSPPPPAPPKVPVPTGLGLSGIAAEEVDTLLGAAEEKKPAKKPVDELPKAGSDMLMIGLLRPSLWVDLAWKGRAKQLGPNVAATVNDGLMVVDLPIAGGRRTWMLGALSQNESVDILSRADKKVAPPPQKLLIKHGDFPLDKVKDFVLDWKGDHTNYPRLYIRKQDIPSLKARLTPNPAMLKKWTSEQPINKYFLDEPIQEFIATGDPTLGNLMAAKAEEYLQTCIDWYLKQDERLTIGAAPHMHTLILSAVNLLDPVLASDAFTPESRKRVLAKLAFLGYVVSSPDYWSPERGYTGFANMTSVVAMYRTALGCMLPSHPQGKAWAEQGLNQLYYQLGVWSDEDGGWIEAPHYAMVSFDHLIAGFGMAANAGFSDHLYDPRMRKVIEWFAGISTPRDARTGGFRHQPPIGNTYHGEPNGIYGIVASLWKQRDPDFASRMQWMFEQHGSVQGLGSGWNFPTMLGYRFLMNNSGVKPKPAEFGSAWYRKTGVVLRNTMTSDRETYLHMIAGENHEHYDYDSGGIMLYGKGRVLSDDWGYFGRHGDNWHSMLTAPSAGGGGIMQITGFAPAAAFDYVSGKKDAWERQIGFAKDKDPLGPNFFLVRDTYSADSDAIWRLWLTTAISADGEKKTTANPGTVSLNATGAMLSGMDDVDMDIFVYEPASLGLKLEPAKLRISTGNWMGNIEPVSNSQTALVATRKGRGAVTTLLYPRLKTEATPTVKWYADGRIAEVTSKAGTDYVFVAPKAAAKPPGDGKTLELVSEVTTKDGVTSVAMAGDDQLKLQVNVPNGVAKTRVVVPHNSIALHPGPINPVTAVWQSPIAGKVDIDVRLHDGEVWGGDGILCELRHGSKVLAKAAMADGGEDVVLHVNEVAVAKGDLVRLVILPGQTNPAESNWYDITVTEMVVKDTAGTQWDLRESLLRGDPLGNQLKSDWEHAVWWICSGDAEKFDPKAFVQPTAKTLAIAEGQPAGDGKTLEMLRGFVTKNGATSAAMPGDKNLCLLLTRSSYAVPEKWISLHPGPKNPVTAVWQSPIAGKVDIDVRLHDAAVEGGDGVLCELRHGSNVLANGVLANGGEDVVLHVDKVAVSKGDLVRLVILPGQTNPEQSNWWDTTATEMIVKDASGTQWDLRESIVRGEQFGNQLGNQLARDWKKAIWWICSGDAETFNAKIFAPVPAETYATGDGKASFQGVAGAIRMRGGKTTLTLGAAGTIRAGKKELSAPEPATND